MSERMISVTWNNCDCADHLQHCAESYYETALIPLSVLKKYRPSVTVGKKNPHQHEEWQIQESARGGYYCAACGADVKVTGKKG